MRFSELDSHISRLLRDVLEESNASVPKKVGKVRDIYTGKDRIALVSTDRLSAFDRSITTIPLKGRILNLLSAWWFSETRHIIDNHLIDIPHPNVLIAKSCKTVPVEFVVRGYMTGSTSTSLWTHYKKGVRKYCGNEIPEGLRKNDKLPEPILTPTTKDDEHDEPLSGAEAVSRGLLTEQVWEQASAAALALFKFGSKVAEDAGYILADTKYEMGIDESGNLILIDEIHTPDSSRFWKAASLPGRISRGEEPESADKEFLRLWYADRCDPYKDENLPEAPKELRLELTQRYFGIYSALTGGKEIPYDWEEDTQKAIAEAVARGLRE
ncbi:phosphoribosylaminoimidazolesuccinocarboxamide synthase [Puniceicoccus vermicola]|uniref:Phosphoribosylaminoimidazole-succinocarboxamide synthase n=1 Tax=Puniceicoccus vermicola TaxID=388746 RepID=A0A7X1AYR7_9BACT|nr:phosphoribosylaminoimidazolesuccinocarboxamide synthase [Puniceicoccus vermicola]MBC2602455.1 phosphoribosylaminoimidazolesuccinocarboxamide synthase [Puniceicoccus vermicola]